MDEAKKKSTVTVADLIATLKTLPRDAVVIMSSDPEGNAIRALDVVSVEQAKQVCLWPGARLAL
jgi:hypothetical protein